MTPIEKEQLNAAIVKKISLTEKAIVDYKDITQPVAPDVAIGRITRMDAINNKSVMESALREAEAKLNRLQSALKKINEPEFGICTKCRQPILFQRLLLMPDSTKCTACSK